MYIARDFYTKCGVFIVTKQLTIPEEKTWQDKQNISARNVISTTTAIVALAAHERFSISNF
jgi:hypothetical protein